ncbi:MAG: hypothetical protein R2852_04300 [Bacteroidia bacterium]
MEQEGGNGGKEDGGMSKLADILEQTPNHTSSNTKISNDNRRKSDSITNKILFSN